jgi:hypothetical protein
MLPCIYKHNGMCAVPLDDLKHPTHPVDLPDVELLKQEFDRDFFLLEPGEPNGFYWLGVKADLTEGTKIFESLKARWQQ